MAMISEWLEPDPDDDWMCQDAEIMLKQEIAYLNIQILPAPITRQHLRGSAGSRAPILRPRIRVLTYQGG
ncbi:hypothetical protein D9619_004830 [Psilocybe cf. subviscida]|uniref:Uncharacterized protein n=1 Tax=Psilocybe cf. subviscida TaxID=2480587 RepID=A0A8H5BPR4_9AGAR|nr:hypothetical protein D9619_004830 [Psilocybe cf. subviscida]